MNAWEVPPVKDSALPVVTGAILLTGMTTIDVKNDRLEFNDRTDRLMQVIRLYQLHKINKIILCGGPATISDADTLDAMRLRDYLILIGINANDIVVEDQSVNTHENAVFTAKMMENYITGKFLLVTSGWHLRRAAACFRHEKIPVIPYSTDRYSGPVKFDIDYLFLPSSATLFNWEKLMHEWIGCIVYYFKGYI